MKLLNRYLFAVLCASLAPASVFAQVPQAFHYQAVARDGAGQILANKAISVRLAILKGTASGSAVYTETHQVTTNDAGAFTLEVGSGTPANSSSFSSIDWISDHYYLSIGIDVSGGTTYEQLGASRLLSVPYALTAQRAVRADSGTGLTKLTVLNSDKTDSSVTIRSVGAASLTPLVVSANTEGANISVLGNTLTGSSNANLQIGVRGNADGTGTGSHIGVLGSANNLDGTIGRRYGTYGQAQSKGRENIGAFGIALGAGDGEIVPIGQEVSGNIGGFNVGSVGFAQGNLNGNLGARGRAYGSAGARINVGVNGTAETNASGWNVGVEAIALNSQTENVGFLGRVLGSGSKNTGMRLHVHNGTTNTGLAVFSDNIAASFHGPLTEVHGNLSVNGNITYSGSLTSTSDRRLKENIRPLRNALDAIMKLSPSSFHFRSGESYPGLTLSKGEHFGLIAQDVETVLPSLVQTQTHRYTELPGEPGGHGRIEPPAATEKELEYKSVNYVELIPFLIKAVQEQQERINAMKEEIEQLKRER
ncbi:MAG: tail fiber domain-containing protein [Bacteroidota bacterium]